jgi:immune inhibitor A
MRKSLVVMAVLVLLQGGFPGHAQTDTTTPPRLTWQDAPSTTPIRNTGDQQLQLGTTDFATIYGPFADGPFAAGDRTHFNIVSADDRREFQLFHRSQHAYFWFRADAQPDVAVLQAAGERFDHDIWPTTRAIYGENATPGIDGDTRIHLVHLDSLYPGLAGFFSPDDQCAREMCARSNQRDTLYLMLDHGPLNSDLYLATIAHEFQHMIQFNVDGNEYRWLDEGMSQLAENLNGFAIDSINQTNLETYLQQPNHPLNSWSNDFLAQSANYGAGYLMAVYLYEQFGEDFIRALARNPLDGLAAIDDTLRTGDHATGIDEVVLNWWIANAVGVHGLGDPRYSYTLFENLPAPIVTPLDMSAGIAVEHGIMQQYGVRYWQLDTPGTYTLTLDADAATALVPGIAPHTGTGAWWSYNASFSATSLTRTIDLTDVNAATLKFWLAGETGDFPGHLHVLASVDGEVWEVVRGNGAAVFNQFSNAPGAHYASTNGEWMADFVDLSAYVGEVMQVRFEYITNSGVTGPGFLIDSVSIPAIGWEDEMESPQSGWQSEGFLYTDGTVSQNWGLAVVSAGNSPQVQRLPVIAGTTTATITVPEGGALIVLGAMAPFTLTPAPYTLTLTAP